MKVKLIEDVGFEPDDSELDEKINDFIKDKKVVDIKYQAVANENIYSGYPQIHQSALIMYEEV